MPTFDLYLPPRAYAVWQAKAQPESAHPFAVAWRAVTCWIERSRQREVLGALDDHMLRDIGITRVEAERECRKPFWR